MAVIQKSELTLANREHAEEESVSAEEETIDQGSDEDLEMANEDKCQEDRAAVVHFEEEVVIPLRKLGLLLTYVCRSLGSQNVTEWSMPNTVRVSVKHFKFNTTRHINVTSSVTTPSNTQKMGDCRSSAATDIEMEDLSYGHGSKVCSQFIL